MMTKIIITLTEAEAKALSLVAASPQEWAENAVKERARIAMEDIFQQEVARMLQDPTITEIPADRETVVLNYQPRQIEVNNEGA